MDRIIMGKPVIPGSAKGIALVAKEPLSLWGGLNAYTGEIIDRRHEQLSPISCITKPSLLSSYQRKILRQSRKGIT